MESDPKSSNGLDAPPSEEELAILSLLAQGLKDDAVARRLGLAKRTYRRRLDNVLAKLGATSRFQAGALALQREWVTLPDQPNEPGELREKEGGIREGGPRSS